MPYFPTTRASKRAFDVKQSGGGQFAGRDWSFCKNFWPPHFWKRWRFPCEVSSACSSTGSFLTESSGSGSETETPMRPFKSYPGSRNPPPAGNKLPVKPLDKEPKSTTLSANRPRSDPSPENSAPPAKMTAAFGRLDKLPVFPDILSESHPGSSMESGLDQTEDQEPLPTAVSNENHSKGAGPSINNINHGPSHNIFNVGNGAAPLGVNNGQMLSDRSQRRATQWAPYWNDQDTNYWSWSFFSEGCYPPGPGYYPPQDRDGRYPRHNNERGQFPEPQMNMNAQPHAQDTAYPRPRPLPFSPPDKCCDIFLRDGSVTHRSYTQVLDSLESGRFGQYSLGWHANEDMYVVILPQTSSPPWQRPQVGHQREDHISPHQLYDVRELDGYMTRRTTILASDHGLFRFFRREDGTVYAVRIRQKDGSCGRGPGSQRPAPHGNGGHPLPYEASRPQFMSHSQPFYYKTHVGGHPKNCQCEQCRRIDLEIQRATARRQKRERDEDHFAGTDGEDAMRS